MHIALLHTAQVHVPRFTATFAAQDADCRLDHVVRPDLLERAQIDGLTAVADDFAATITPLLRADAVLCTCSTLGPLVDALSTPKAIRIDRPMMEMACRLGPRIGVAICLDSTRDATLGLLHQVAQENGGTVRPVVIDCTAAWGAFTAGDLATYQAMIVDQVAQACAASDFDGIVLAQASMADAATGLASCGTPVLTAPEAATNATLDAARNGL